MCVCVCVISYLWGLISDWRPLNQLVQTGTKVMYLFVKKIILGSLVKEAVCKFSLPPTVVSPWQQVVIILNPLCSASSSGQA